MSTEGFLLENILTFFKKCLFSPTKLQRNNEKKKLNAETIILYKLNDSARYLLNTSFDLYQDIFNLRKYIILDHTTYQKRKRKRKNNKSIEKGEKKIHSESKYHILKAKIIFICMIDFNSRNLSSALSRLYLYATGKILNLYLRPYDERKCFCEIIFSLRYLSRYFVFLRSIKTRNYTFSCNIVLLYNKKSDANLNKLKIVRQTLCVRTITSFFFNI